jgi:hypothetical protein
MAIKPAQKSFSKLAVRFQQLKVLHLREKVVDVTYFFITKTERLFWLVFQFKFPNTIFRVEK